MKANRSVIAVLGVLLALAWSGCIIDVDINDVDEYASAPFYDEIDADRYDRVLVRGINGRVEVAGQAGLDEIIIDGERTVGSDTQRDAERHLDDLEVVVYNEGRTLVIETEQPRSTHGREYVVDYEITVPDDIQVVIVNVNGDVQAADLDNYASVELVNGSVQLDNLFADVDVRLTNGSILADLALPDNAVVDLRTVNGDIDLFVPRTTSAELSAQVTNGRVSVSNLTVLDVVQSSRSLEGTLGSGRGEILLRSTNGRIRIEGLP